MPRKTRQTTPAEGEPTPAPPARKSAAAKEGSSRSRPSRKKADQAAAAERNGSRPGLVIVESPKKAKSIGKFLGSDYVVKASMGHVRDLPKRKLGLEIAQGYKPSYEVVPAKKETIGDLKRTAARTGLVYLATDPDREGEAIAWHLQHALGLEDDRIRRVTFHEITERAVKDAFSKSGPINMDMVNAQQARRFLDRVVGYQLSPLLWKKVGARNLSAGRVQSVAVRLIADREREIKNFVTDEYWKIAARVSPKGATEPESVFKAALAEFNGAKFEAKTEAAAHAVRDALQAAEFRVSKVEETEKLDRAEAPFKTSSLQQQAVIRLRFSGKKAMKIAQELYEGIDVDGSGPVGLITYMRTDSLRVSDEAITAVRDRIKTEFGEPYLPPKPIRYAAGKLAQEAHEAIRPTELKFSPDQIKNHLTHDQFRLYQLIYNRFLASQMAPAVYMVTDVAITAGAGLFKAQGKVQKFDGHRRVWPQHGKHEDELLPAVSAGQPLDLHALDATQHFTQPPPRYSEATLIKALEKEAIGRPSTYAPIIQTIQDRGYVEQQRAAIPRHRSGHGRQRPPGRAVPQDPRPEIHRPHGGQARRDCLGQGRHGQGARRVLLSVPGRAAGGRNAHGAGADSHQRNLPRLRCTDGAQVRQDRPVPGLLEVSRVQGNPAARRPASRRGSRERAHLPQVLEASLDSREQARREIPVMLGVPRVQGIVQHRRRRQAGPRCGRDRIYLREMRQADGDAPGPPRGLHRVHRLPQVPQCPAGGRPGSPGSDREGGSRVPQVRRTDGGAQWPSRTVPGLSQVSQMSRYGSGAR